MLKKYKHEEPFYGDGEIRALLRSVDWSKTPLGPVASWPKSLIGIIQMILELPTPAIVFWGPEFIQIYNSGYAAIMGPLHPKYFGALSADCWPDTYPVIEPIMRKVLAGGVETFVESYFPVVRSGFSEEAYFTLTFSPIRNDTGEIAGIFQPILEVTASVLAKRRAATLLELTQVLDAAQAVAILSCNAKDVPFTSAYLWNNAEGRLEVAAVSDALGGHDCADLHNAAREAFDTGARIKIDDLGFAPAGTWGDPVRSAYIVPLPQSRRGVMIFGISPNLPFDDTYRLFLESAAASVDSAGERAILVARELSARKERETLFRQFADSIPQLAWIAKSDGQVYWCNKRWHEYAGTTPKDIEEGWGAKSVHPADLPDIVERWKLSLDTGTALEMVVRLRGADGQYRSFLTRAHPLKNETGQVLQWFGTNTDIEDQRNSEQRIIDVLESMGDAFISLDKNFKILRVNRHQERISGLNREQTVGRNHWDVWPKEIIPKIWEAYEKVIRDRVPVRIEDFNSELKIWLAVDAYPTPDGGVAAFFRDITEQKRMFQRLQDEKTKLESIFENSPASMSLLRGPTFILEKVNSGYQQLVGRRDVIDKTVFEATPEVDMRPFIDHLKGVFETGIPYSVTEAVVPLIRTPGGEPQETYLDFTYSRVNDGQGKPYGIYGYAVDITEKVMARKHIEQLAKSLSESVHSRDEFMSIASHELKTPITGMKIQTQMFKRAIKNNSPHTLAPSKVAEIMNAVDFGLDRMTRLVDDMLDISRIQFGKLTVQCEPTNITTLVGEIIDRLRPALTGAGIAVDLKLNDGLRCNLDRFRFEQVLTNLATNAIRYAPNAPVEVELKKENNLVVLRFRDHGPGITQVDHEKVFKRFERLVSANQISGMGLGLYICREIAEAHGGSIRIDAETYPGTCFLLEFPVEVSV